MQRTRAFTERGQIMDMNWYVMMGKEQQGPFTEAALKNLLAGGRIFVHSNVWCQGMGEWKPLSEVSELQGIATSASTPPPPKPSNPATNTNSQGPMEMDGPKVKAVAQGKLFSDVTGKLRIVDGKLIIKGLIQSKDVGYLSDLRQIVFTDKGRKKAEFCFSGNSIWKIEQRGGGKLSNFAEEIQRELGNTIIRHEIKDLDIGKAIGGIIGLGIFLYIFYNMFLGGAEREAAQTMREIENQVAQDSIVQYNIAKRNGSQMEVCTYAGMVAAAWMQAKNEAEYARWRQIQSQECRAAGIPF